MDEPVTTTDVRRVTFPTAAVVVALLLVLALHLPSTIAPPLAGTEGHRAITGHQMLRDGNWLVPMLFDQPYLRKPPLMYWSVAGAEAVFGPREWVWRLPSVISAALTAALAAVFAARWFGRRSAWWAGIGFATLVPLWEQSRTADIDAVLTFFTTASVLLLIESVMPDEPRPLGSGDARPSRPARSRSGLVVCMLAGISAGLAMLAKGPALLPAWLGVAAAVLWLGRGARVRSILKIGLVLAVAAAVVLAWLLPMMRALDAMNLPADTSGAREGLDNVTKLLREPHRILEVVALPLLLVLFALPMSLSLLAVRWRGGRDPLPADRVARLLGLGFLLGLFVCVVSGMTNVRYAYVLLPLLPLLWAYAIERWLDGAPEKLPLAQSALRWTTALLLIGSALTTNWFVRDRTERSAKQAGLTLREIVGPGSTVRAGRMILSKPELFFYAGVTVRSPGQRPLTIDDIEPGDILVLYDSEREPEYSTLRNQLGDRLQLIAEIPTDPRPVWVCRYAPADE